MSEHDFVGKHLIANYVGCNHRALSDLSGVYAAMEAGAQAAGATVVGSSRHVFVGGGFSLVLLLSESHASIHTYPEVDSCFIDMFTCGTTCDPHKFDAIMQAFLKPRKANNNLITRDKGEEEKPDEQPCVPAVCP